MSASDELKSELEGYNELIRENNRRWQQIEEEKQREKEINRKNSLYEDADRKFKVAKTEKDYIEAAKSFKKVLGWRDADNRIKIAEEKADEVKKNEIYRLACSLSEHEELASLNEAKNEFNRIPGWMDADKRKQEIIDRITKIETELDNARRKKTKKIHFIIITTLLIIVISVLAVSTYNKEIKYKKAKELWDSGQEQKAVTILQDIYSYKDSSEYVDKFKNAIVDQLKSDKWTTSRLSDTNGSTTWDGYYYLDFIDDENCILSWDGYYSGRRVESSQGESNKTYRMTVTDNAVLVTIASDNGKIYFEDGTVETISLDFCIYNESTIYFEKYSSQIAEPDK